MWWWPIVEDALQKYLAVIPAREGSKRIPDKNLLSVGGRSLIQRAADSVRESEIYKNGEVRLVCCTNSAKCEALAVSAGLEVFPAPPWFATTDRSLNETLEHVSGHVGAEIAMLVLATAPFRRGPIFDQVAEALERRPDAKVAMSMIPALNTPEWTFQKNGSGLYNYRTFPDVPDVDNPDPTYQHDGQVWAIRVEELARAKTATQTTELAGVFGDWPDTLDLNWPWQLEMAEFIAEKTGL